LIEHVSSIQCYTCHPEGGYHCIVPPNFEAGDESNENDVEVSGYDPDYACLVEI